MDKLPRFRDREHAGALLAEALARRAIPNDAIVLALPRGGVPVAFVVARALHLELDILLVRKLGLPGHEELAIGAIASGGVRILDTTIIDAYGIPAGAIEAVSRREHSELARREARFRGPRPEPHLQGRTVVLIDDGLATGSTMRAAIAAARAQGSARIIVAVPVGAASTCAALAPEVNELICLKQPQLFRAVSQWYEQFGQTSDAQVQDLLAQAWQPSPAQTPGASRSRLHHSPGEQP
jgi:predicted phosphoribosyltransferase